MNPDKMRVKRKSYPSENRKPDHKLILTPLYFMFQGIRTGNSDCNTDKDYFFTTKDGC